jgi:hypothetical protein
MLAGPSLVKPQVSSAARTVEREQLPMLDELGVRVRRVHLGVEQVPAVPEDFGCVDDPRRLLVLKLAVIAK